MTISPSFNLYRMVVFPAASRPTIKIRISFLPHILSNNLEKVRPILAAVRKGRLDAVALGGGARSAQSAVYTGLLARSRRRGTEGQDQRSDWGKRDGWTKGERVDGLDLTVKDCGGVPCPPCTAGPGDGSGAGMEEAKRRRTYRENDADERGRWQSVDGGRREGDASGGATKACEFSGGQQVEKFGRARSFRH